MPDVFHTECYFLSSEMAKLCVDTRDIKVAIKVAYPPGKVPEFTIEASGMNGEIEGGEPIPGCPTPCR